MSLSAQSTSKRLIDERTAEVELAETICNHHTVLPVEAVFSAPFSLAAAARLTHMVVIASGVQNVCPFCRHD